MKTGIELIAEERAEQIEKHGRTIETDIEQNAGGQLEQAAVAILLMDYSEEPGELYPTSWSEDFWLRMPNKTPLQRLIIVGALIAAEIDRINYSAAKEQEGA